MSRAVFSVISDWNTDGSILMENEDNWLQMEKTTGEGARVTKVCLFIACFRAIKI